MAAITIINGLAFVAVVLHANNQNLLIEKVLLDTGAAASVFRTDDLATIDVVPERKDRLRFMSGIGGREPVIEKQIEKIEVGNLVLTPFVMQLGAIDYGFAINGILGMDFLLKTGTVINIRQLTIT